jgi:splicing factor 3B subunit 4
LFIGNLDPEVDEKQLWETFSRFGVLIAPPKIMRESDPSSNRGYAFLNYDSFEAADTAIEQMNGQFLCGRPISVNYAFKKDSKTERHGSMAERILAANNPNKLPGMPRPVVLPPPTPISAPVQPPTGPPAGFRPPAMRM